MNFGDRLLVMSPHTDDFDGLDIIQDLVDKPLLDVYATRAGAGQIADQLLVWRRNLVWIRFEKIEQAECLRFQA